MKYIVVGRDGQAGNNATVVDTLEQARSVFREMLSYENDDLDEATVETAVQRGRWDDGGLSELLLVSVADSSGVDAILESENCEGDVVYLNANGDMVNRQ